MSTRMNDLDFPLRNVRVIDMGRYISGPYTATLLAELGADVLKVEPPNGDPFRKWDEAGLGPAFVAFNRGKRSVTIDLKESEGIDRLLGYIEKSDVLIENFRPGVMERLDIGWERIHKVNQSLVHCSITGFGAKGPYAQRPAYDGVALGYSGLARLLMDPVDVRLRGPALADTVTARYAALSILSALIARHESGEGRHLEVSMIAALMHFLPNEISRSVMLGEDDGPYDRVHRSQAFAFPTADDQALIVHLSSPTKFWEGLCEAVGRRDLINDPRFANRDGRVANSEELRQELSPVFLERSREEWLAVLQQHHVPCAPVNSISESLVDREIRDLGVVEIQQDADLGRIPVIRPPLQDNGHGLPAIQRPPLLGEHNDTDIWSHQNSSD